MQIRRGLAALLMGLASNYAVAQTALTADRHVIIISIDGFRPAVYLHPDAEGLRLPTLRKLKDDGVFVEKMIGVLPSVTYPSHTTLVTGTYPSSHGVTVNFKYGNGKWFKDSRDIKDETLWQAAKRAGLTTAIVTWPMSYGADVDWLIPEDLSDDSENVSAAIRANGTPGLFDKLEKETKHEYKFDTLEKTENVKILDDMTAVFAAQVFKDNKPNLMLLHFLMTDECEHLYGPYSAKAHEAYEGVDKQISIVLQAVRDAGVEGQTDVIVTGDHGFVPIHTGLNINHALIDMGYATLSNGKVVYRVVEPEFQATGSGAFYAKSDATPGQINEFNERLRAYFAQHYRNLLTLVSADELRRKGAYPGAVSAVTVDQPGFYIIAFPVEEATVPLSSPGGTHGYDPEMPEMAVGFIAKGPDFAEHLDVSLIRSVDVAPTVARVLHIDLPDTDGLVISGLLSPAVNKEELDRVMKAVEDSTRKVAPKIKN